MQLSLQPGSGQIAQAPSRSGRSIVASKPQGPARRTPAWLLWAVTVGTPVLLFLLWWLASAGSTNPFFPPLSRILTRFGDLWLFANFQSDIIPSLRNLVVSYAIAVVIGVGLGTLLGLNRTVAAVLDPVIHFWRAIPSVALVPILVAVLGFGDDTRILAITLAATFPTLIATIDGLRGVEPLMKDMSSVYQIPRLQRIIKVYLPAASPRVASGMQVSLQAAFVVMIASEMMGSATGIGAKTLLAQQTFATTDMWAGILLLGLIGFSANLLFETVERRVLAWHINSQSGNGKS